MSDAKITLGVLLVVTLTWRPVEGAPAPSGMSPILTHFFQDYPGFSATAEVTLGSATEAGQSGETMTMPMKFYFRQGDMRTELNMTEVKTSSEAESLGRTLQQIGMDQVVTILQAGTGQTMVLYPKRRVYIPQESQATAAPSFAVKRKTNLGEEIILGRNCQKSSVTLTGPTGQDVTVLLWQAPRLRDFPVQIQMAQAGGTLTVRYRDVSFVMPKQQLFAVPSQFQKRDNAESIMREASEELLGQQP